MRQSSPLFALVTLVVACLVVWALPALGQEATDTPQPEANAAGPAFQAEQAGPAGAEKIAPAVAPAIQPEAEAETGPAPVTETAVEQPAPAPGVPPPGLVPPPVVAVDVIGNVLVPENEIRKVIKTQPGSQYSPNQVKADVEAIRNIGSFKRVWEETTGVENGVRIAFHVVENEVIADIQFEGNRELSSEQLLGAMKTRPGEIYNARKLAQDAQAIERLYAVNGYVLAIVLSQRMSETGVLTLTILEGEIEEIKITGNTHTKTYAIRRYLRSKVGETYNSRKVSRDVNRLNALGWFETVRGDAEVGTEPGKVIVIITVVERKRTGMATVGGGYSSAQGLVGIIDLTKSNVGGNGQQVSIRGEFGGRTSYELGYQHPWVMTPETRLSTGIYDRLILREAFITDEESVRHTILYDERRNGGNMTLGRPLSERLTVYLGVRADDISITGLSQEEEALLKGGQANLPEAFQPRDVRSLTLAAVNDTRDDFYNPRRGFYQRFSAEFAGVFGGVDFNKYVSDSRRYLGMGRRNVLALRLMVGAVTGEAPYLERFLIGGSESLRGFRTDRFVGTRMAILNTEYRFPVSENLLGVVFVDYGDAWGGVTSTQGGLGDTIHEQFDGHLGYGAGIRVKTPIGPLRLDLGFSEDGTETHFGVRHMF